MSASLAPLAITSCIVDRSMFHSDRGKHSSTASSASLTKCSFTEGIALSTCKASFRFVLLLRMKSAVTSRMTSSVTIDLPSRWARRARTTSVCTRADPSGTTGPVPLRTPRGISPPSFPAMENRLRRLYRAGSGSVSDPPERPAGSRAACRRRSDRQATRPDQSPGPALVRRYFT